MRVQAEKVALTLLEHLEDQRATAVVFAIVLAVGLLGIPILGSYFYAKTLAPMGPSPEPEFADGEEKKAILTQDEHAVLATRKATVFLPLPHASVLGSLQWEGITQVRYSDKHPDSGRLVEICADVKERARSIPSMDQVKQAEGPPPLSELTLKTVQGALVRINGEEAALEDPGIGEDPMPLENGCFVCPLLHLDDRNRLAKKSEELYKNRLVAGSA